MRNVRRTKLRTERVTKKSTESRNGARNERSTEAWIKVITEV